MRGFSGAAAVLLLATACAPKPTTTFRAAPTALSPVSCVAVLPFENLTDAPGAGESLADLVSVELMKTGRFHVMDRAESARILATRGIYVSATVDAGTARAMGDVLGVQAVVVGTVSDYHYALAGRKDRPSHATLGVTTRLLDVKTGDPLWGAKFSGTPSTFFDDASGPLYLAAQRVAANFSQSLVADAGAGTARASGPPCWQSKAQSVLATLAPTNRPSGTPVAVATAAMATPTPFAAVTPTPFAAGTMTAPTPTPAPTLVAALATPTPAPTAPPIKLTASQEALLGKMKAGAQFVLDGVAFTAMTEKLAPTATPVLADLAQVLKAHPEAKLQIQAHMDPTDPGPVPLSQKRAEAVVSSLIASGVQSGQLEPKGMGGSKSLFPSFVEAMKAKNRRVEIVVEAAPVVTAAVASATPAAGGSLSAGTARVKVLAAKGTTAAAVKLANSLKQAGTKVTTMASVPEAHNSTLVYYSPKHKEEAAKLAKALLPGGAKLSPSNNLGAGVDIVILVGADLK